MNHDEVGICDAINAIILLELSFDEDWGLKLILRILWMVPCLFDTILVNSDICKGYWKQNEIIGIQFPFC